MRSMFLKRLFICLVDVSDILIFFCSRRGKGESEAPGGGWGSVFFLKIPGGGVSRRGRGAEGLGGRVQRIGELGGGGVGAKHFFSGPKCPPSLLRRQNPGAFLGTTKETKMPFLAPPRPTF